MPWLLCLATVCGTNASLTYRVSYAPESPHQLAITLQVNGAPRDSLSLRGYTSSEILHVTGLRAVGARGVPLPVEASIDTVSNDGQRVGLPRYTLRGPLPSSLTVSYVVTPGRREGNSHTGFTGRCSAYVGPEFALVTGRDIFLLPQHEELAVVPIAVRFTLPSGWSAVTPWKKSRERWITGIQGRLTGEHLISAGLGLGRFHERSFRSGRTAFVLAFDSRTPREQEEQAAARIERAARYVRGIFGRDLGESYVTIVAPETPTGDEVVGEGWSTGQGRTLAPLTGNRLREFAARLIDAYTRHAPYRTEIRSPEEYWLVDAITNWYAWRAVAAAGLVGADETDRAFAVSYVSAFAARGIEHDLERLYATADNARIGREALAPFVLLHLDHELRSTRASAAGFDPILRRMFHGRTAPSLWSSLPNSQRAHWQEFRARYVRGAALAPVETYFSIAPTRPRPDPPRGAALRRLTVVFTGDSYGYLENCGCKVNQSGGVARRTTVLRGMRCEDPALILLDAGNAFIRPDKLEAPDFFSRKEQLFYLRMMDFLRYDASAIGSTELAYGLDHFRDMTRGIRTPYLAANILDGGTPIGPAWTIVRSRGFRIAVIGLFEPPRGQGADPVVEAHTASLTIEDPVEALRRVLPSVRPQADLIFVIGRLTPVTIRRLVAACPGVDAVLSVDDDAPGLRRNGDVSELTKEDSPGFLGGTLVLYTPLRNYGLSRAELGLDREGRIASVAIENHWLRKDVRDDPVVRERLNRFYDEVGRIDAAQASVRPLFEDDPVRLTGRYVGAAECRDCHREEYTQWKTTKHATAYKTLLDAHRHYQPRCVSCHVVGYGTRYGYRIGASEEPLGNVQCEACHGPGGEHVRAPELSNIVRLVPEKVCLECHNPEHSDRFVYGEQLPKVRHD